eukprot:TRINITY_DN32585_c0_g1_i1.p1 TRINITY_DN32585_c0_g1~~TRINITY_DN32585_c0_g1_i1.p1  ORF type:complete len:385 (+),score=108.54 TRINITY_DN32585_c0_g1_i1:85-1239(+)
MPRCPVCSGELPAAAAEADTCPSCGSLEGLQLHADSARPARPAGRLFGQERQRWQDGFLTPFWASRPDKINIALQAAGVTQADLFYDLGCGDGAAVVAAARDCGARGRGCDLDADLVAAARQAAEAAGVGPLCEFEHCDFREPCIAAATVVYVCLHEGALRALNRQLLQAWLSGARIVSAERRLPGIEWESRLANATDDGFWFQRGLWVYARDTVAWRGVDRMLCLYQPSRLEKIEACFAECGVTAADLVADLGSGTGEALIFAAGRFGCRCLGVELDPDLVAQADRAGRAAGVDAQIDWVVADFREVDLSAVTVVFLYLLPPVLRLIDDVLLRLWERGARIAANCYAVPGWGRRLRRGLSPEQCGRRGFWVYSKEAPEREAAG